MPSSSRRRPGVRVAAGVTLSGGGTRRLARMSIDGRSLSLTLPMGLPAPPLDGAAATYPNLLPGVDLRVTADLQGGFAQVLVVHSATAAANPALRALAL